MNRHTVSIITSLALSIAAPAHADSPSKGSERATRPTPDAEQAQAPMKRGIRSSGLVPVFPTEARCTAIASAFGSPSRYDGSRRPASRFGGLHGGIDLTLDENTPLLAIAAGKIIGIGVGGQAEGIHLWLQHAPQDTGLPFWLYSKYQHLSELPQRAVGDFLKVGEVIALSGKTGTVGGHYGSSGYGHLHLTTLAGPSDQYESDGSRIVVESARMIDPLAIFARDLKDANEIEQLPAGRSNVRISYAAVDGLIHPAGSRTVWPVHCK